jgi:DKNYY family
MGLISFLIACFSGEKSTPFTKKDGAWWYRDTRITQADVATFQPLSDHYAKDANRVFHVDTYRDSKEYWLVKRVRVQVLDGADPATFVSLDVDYAKDARSVWYAGERMRAVRDVATFTVLDRAWTRDKVQGYFDQAAVAGSDGTTFARISDRYARDASKVWHCRNEIDGESHRAVPACTTLEGADVATFAALDGAYARDASHVWHEASLLEADVSAFRTLSFDYATDGRRTWYQGTPFDADAATFSYDSGLLARGADARDGRGYFREGKRVTLTPVDSTTR